MSAPPSFRQPRQPWDASMWSIVGIVPLTIALALVFTTRAGALCLAGYLAAAALLRAFGPDSALSAFRVRARWFDVTALGSLAFVIGTLGLLAPPA